MDTFDSAPYEKRLKKAARKVARERKLGVTAAFIETFVASLLLTPAGGAMVGTGLTASLLILDRERGGHLSGAGTALRLAKAATKDKDRLRHLETFEEEIGTFNL